MRRTVAVAVLALASVASLSSCSNGSGDESTGPTVTTLVETTSSSSSSSTTAATSTTVGSRPTTTSASASPEGAARALFDAWTRDDRAAAQRVAQPEAVATLFARRWQAADGWSFSECSGAAGSLICTWQRPAGEQVLFRVPNVTGGGLVAVAEVRFQP